MIEQDNIRDTTEDELTALRRELLSFLTEEMARGGIDGSNVRLNEAIVAELRAAAREAMTEALHDHNREISTLSASISRSIDRPTTVNVEQLAEQLAARLRGAAPTPAPSLVEDPETIIADEPSQGRLSQRLRGWRNAAILFAILVGALAIALVVLLFTMQQRIDEATQATAAAQERVQESHADNRRAERTILQLCAKLNPAPAAGHASSQTTDANSAAALCAK